MEELITKLGTYWRYLGTFVISILWLGRLSWRISDLEKKDKIPKPPTVSPEACKETRQHCQKEVKEDLEHLIAQMDFLMQHLITGDIEVPKKKKKE